MYAYLAWAIFFGIVWIFLFLYRKDLRFEIIFSSLLFLPFGLTQPLFVPEYWNPVVVFKLFGLFDIESLLWCFFTGGIVSVLFEEIFKIKLKKSNLDKKSRHHAYVVYCLLLLTVFILVYIKYFTNLSVLRSSFIFIIFVFIYFIKTRPDLLTKSIISGIIFTVLYIGSLILVDKIFPGFILNQWTIQGSIGIKLYHIVIEEYVYAFLFGISWSIIYEEIKNIRLDKTFIINKK